jgi:hypothetical protein
VLTPAAGLGFAFLSIVVTPGASFTLVTGRALVGDCSSLLPSAFVAHGRPLRREEGYPQRRQKFRL